MARWYLLGDLKIRVTQDTVKAEGYEEWVAVLYLTTEQLRTDAVKWYVGLINRGIIKQEVK